MYRRNVHKQINPSITTIVGGAIITADPELAMRNMNIDYGIIGEGEITICELMSAIQMDTPLPYVSGIIYRSLFALHTTPPRLPILDLDSLPFPDYESFDYSHHVTLFSPSSAGIFYTPFDTIRPGKIVASRSCPYSCTFCYHPLGKTYRQRSLDNIFQEIDYLVSHYNINFLSIQDELFATSPQRLLEFASRITPYHITWGCQLRVSDVDDSTLALLKSSGLYMISYGIESLSPTILNSMKKHITVPEIENALSLTRKHNIAIQGNILFGDPAETCSTIQESISWWRSNPQYGINLSMIITLPNSPIYQYALSHSRIKDKLQYMQEGIQVINLTNLSTSDFLRLSIFVWNSSWSTIGVPIAHIINSFPLTIKCLLCSNISIYNFPQQESEKYFLILCKHCLSRLRIRTRQTTLKSFLKYQLFNIARLILINSSIARFLYYKFGNIIVKRIRNI
jgi:radical SAM superfamily enzyme YgiQ (UPF0313 family)